MHLRTGCLQFTAVFPHFYHCQTKNFPMKFTRLVLINENIYHDKKSNMAEFQILPELPPIVASNSAMTKFANFSIIARWHIAEQ